MRINLFVLFVLSSVAISAQIDRTRTWYFGQGIGLNFDLNGGLKLLDSFKDFSYEGTGIWNSLNGNMKYYTGGGILYNKNHDSMNVPPDWFINSRSSSQNVSMTSINDEWLHIFTTSPYYNIGGYRYHLFNMLEDTFVLKNYKLQKGISECQTLVNHQNGQWQWVVSHSLLGDTLFSYLINQEGLETCPVISHAGPFYKDRYPGQGVMKFSPNGKYLFFATFDLFKVVVCSFNNQTGEIKELFSIADKLNFGEMMPYGLEVMDNKLFTSSIRTGKIHEFDLSKMDSGFIAKSRRLVYDTSDIYSLGQIQRAPNGKMYVAYYESHHLGELEKVGGVWTHKYTADIFKPKFVYSGFPNFNASYFYQPALSFTYKHSCHSHAFSFTAKDTFAANSFTWNFTKGSQKESKTGKQLSYTFLDTGLWKVQLIASKGTRTDTTEKSIEVFAINKPGFLGTDHYYTQGQMVQGNLLAPAKQHCSHWWRLGDTLETTGSIYTYTDTGTYVCKTTNKHFCHRWDTVQVKLCDSIPTAILSRVKDTLFLSQTATHIHWYKNGAELPANRNQTRLTLNAEGNYHVVLINAQGCADSSNLENITFLYAGLKPINKQGIFIYPNPNTGEFTIKGIKPNTAIKIVDQTGREVAFRQKGNTIQLNPSSAGLYYLRVEGQTFKLLVE